MNEPTNRMSMVVRAGKSCRALNAIKLSRFYLPLAPALSRYAVQVSVSVSVLYLPDISQFQLLARVVVFFNEVAKVPAKVIPRYHLVLEDGTGFKHFVYDRFTYFSVTTQSYRCNVIVILIFVVRL